MIGFYAVVTDTTDLKRIDSRKSELVSMEAYESCTPLTSIGGSLGLIAEVLCPPASPIWVISPGRDPVQCLLNSH